jgi:hypothetical protein
MTTLVLGLYAEGRTDERFLPMVIQRTVERILIQRGRFTIDVLEPIVLNHSIDRKGEDQRILEAARRAVGYHALIVHADADAPSPERALNNRFKPGLERVQQALQAEEQVCDHLAPIIPVQMTEAWMLADPEALRLVIGTNIPARTLGLPTRTRQVEADADPKQTLKQVMQMALAHRPRRRRRVDLGVLYEPLGRQISLERLGAVPAYQRFVEDVTETLIDLHFAE